MTYTPTMLDDLDLMDVLDLQAEADEGAALTLHHPDEYEPDDELTQ